MQSNRDHKDDFLCSFSLIVLFYLNSQIFLVVIVFFLFYIYKEFQSLKYLNFERVSKDYNFFSNTCLRLKNTLFIYSLFFNKSNQSYKRKMRIKIANTLCFSFTFHNLTLESKKKSLLWLSSLR